LWACVSTSDNQKWPISMSLELSCDNAMTKWSVQFNPQRFDNDELFFSSHLLSISCSRIHVWPFKIQLHHLVCIYFSFCSHCLDSYPCWFLCFFKIFCQFCSLLFYFIWLLYQIWFSLSWLLFYNPFIDFFFNFVS
jgi:hypothetical protein